MGTRVTDTAKQPSIGTYDMTAYLPTRLVREQWFICSCPHYIVASRRPTSSTTCTYHTSTATHYYSHDNRTLWLCMYATWILVHINLYVALRPPRIKSNVRTSTYQVYAVAYVRITWQCYDIISYKGVSMVYVHVSARKSEGLPVSGHSPANKYRPREDHHG